MKSLLALITLLFMTIARGQADSVAGAKKGGWRAGIAKVVITPKAAMWMAGYAGRNRVAEGKIQDLWAKAIALEDAQGRRSVLLTLDLCTIPKAFSDYVRGALQAKLGLTRAQVLINCSHTHSGPVLSSSLSALYSLDAAHRGLVKAYTEGLQNELILLVTGAFKALQPVQLFAENGLARFGVNRRTNNEASLLLQTELKGPTEYAVPVLKISEPSGVLLAIVFGYACHNTVLNGYQWSGDYAGFAQVELEKRFPGVTALFVQGAGGDQNPLPRQSVALAAQYGKEIAYAVEKVISEPMHPLQAKLSTAYGEIQLPLNPPPSQEALAKMASDSSVAYKRKAAQNLLEQLQRGGVVRRSYPYPVQVWKLGDQPLFALGGELVSEYAIEIKKLFGDRSFVLGYSNDVMGYIPSTTILRESNDKADGYAFYNPVNKESISYEGGLSTQLAYGLPGTWSADVENLILAEVQRVAAKAGVALSVFK